MSTSGWSAAERDRLVYVATAPLHRDREAARMALGMYALGLGQTWGAGGDSPGALALAVLMDGWCLDAALVGAGWRGRECEVDLDTGRGRQPAGTPAGWRWSWSIPAVSRPTVARRLATLHAYADGERLAAPADARVADLVAQQRDGVITASEAAAQLGRPLASWRQTYARHQ